MERNYESIIRERISSKIGVGSTEVNAAVARLLSEGKIAQDFIAPIGFKNSNPVLTFSSNGRVNINLHKETGDQKYSLHTNAVSQLADKMKIPGGYLRSLSTGSEWEKGLASTILNEHSSNTDRERVLIRSVGNEVRGVLSDRFRRLNSVTLISAFLEEVQKNGGMMAAANYQDTKMWFEAIYPQPIAIPTPKNGTVYIAFGARMKNSDYGDGTLELRSFMIQGVCLNGMVRDSVLRQVHLGGRLPDNLLLSEKTYELDTMTQTSVIRDLTGQLFSPNTIKERAAEIMKASEVEVDLRNELLSLNSSQRLGKKEVDSISEIFMKGDVNDGIAGENTLWKLVNGVTAFARDQEPERKRELEEIAGQLMDRVSFN